MRRSYYEHLRVNFVLGWISSALLSLVGVGALSGALPRAALVLGVFGFVSFVSLTATYVFIRLQGRTLRSVQAQILEHL